MGIRIRSIIGRVAENQSLQFHIQFFFCFSGQILHICHVHAGVFIHAVGQSILCSVCTGDLILLADRPFREQVGFFYKFAFFIYFFQCRQQRITGIYFQNPAVFLFCQPIILLHKPVVILLHFLLLAADFRIFCTVQLQSYQIPQTIPNRQCSTNSGFCICCAFLFCLGEIGQFRRKRQHDAVLFVIQLAVHNGIGIVPHIFR